MKIKLVKKKLLLIPCHKVIGNTLRKHLLAHDQKQTGQGLQQKG
jgi:hypothetical protein